MFKSVFGLANNRDHAERIVDALQKNGFTNDEISLLLADKGNLEKRTPTSDGMTTVTEKKPLSKTGALVTEKNTKAPEGGTTGAVTGGIIGGAIGLLAGIGTIAIPGLGAFVAAGPILAALSGTGVGGTVGLVVGALVGLDLPEYEAKKYEEGINSGNALICVHCDNNDEVNKATDILKRANAKDISNSREKSASKR